MESLLSQLLPHERDLIRELAGQTDMHSTIEECLARSWDFEGYERARGKTDEQIADKLAHWSSLYPDWSPEQVRTALAFDSVFEHWKVHPVVRRIVRDDPAELGRGQCIAGRLHWLHVTLLDQACPGLGGDVTRWEIALALAVRDAELARRVAECPVREETDEVDALIAEAIVAALRRDLDALRTSAGRMARLKVPREQRWVSTCLKGIAERDPELATRGLQQSLDEERRKRERKEGEVISLWAHGFYRLCEWVSPDLVAGFDVTQPLPWDAAFHAWVEEHPNPLEGTDLTGISPVLHDAVIHLRPPAYWVPSSELGHPRDVCEVVLTNVGPCVKDVIDIIQTFCRAWKKEVVDIGRGCPLVVISGIPRLTAFMMRKELARVGASAEVGKV